MIKASVKVNVTGFDATLVPIKSRDVTLKAVKAGAKIVSKAVKSRAPKASGTMRVAIGWKAKKGSNGATPSYAVIGAKKNVRKIVTRKKRWGKKPMLAVPAKILHLLELGVKPHMIGKRKHPGAEAKPFVAPAYETVKDEAAEAIRKGMGDAVNAAIAKASSGSKR